MRATTQRKIDALHAQIAELIEREKRYRDRKNPDENSLWRTVAHAKIDMARHCPDHRANMREATALLPSMHRKPPNVGDERTTTARKEHGR